MERRVPLTKQDYVAAAFEVADEVGLASLTLKALGERLGVDATAVYRHFGSKDLLLLAMLDELLSGVLAVEPVAVDPRQELISTAWAMRKVLLAHPPLAEALALIADVPNNSLRLTDRVVGGLARLGLSGDQLVVHYQLMEHFVLGSCLIESSGAPDNWEVRRRRYERIGSPEFRAAASTAANVERLAELTYSTGLDILLASAEAAARNG